MNDGNSEYEVPRCIICKLNHVPYPVDVCGTCSRNLPRSLGKACGDEFTYAMRLKTGEMILFSRAEIDGEFVHITGTSGAANECVEGLRYPCPRGVDVRITDIVWCADAPEGS